MKSVKKTTISSAAPFPDHLRHLYDHSRNHRQQIDESNLAASQSRDGKQFFQEWHKHYKA